MSDQTTNPGDGELLPDAEVDDIGALAPDGDGLETEVELDDDGNPIEPPDEDEEVEELEHEGKKYALPKVLKPLLLMQADYTKKTQDLAEDRKVVAAERDKLAASLTAAVEADDAIVDAKAAVKAIDARAAELKSAITAVETELANVDWSRLHEMENGEALYRQREQYLRQLRLSESKLTEDRTKLTGDLDTKVKARDDAKSKHAIELQQSTAKQIEERDAALKAKFPQWSEEFPAIQAFVAKTFGIPAEDVAGTPSPALLEIARYAKLGFEAEQRQRTAQAATRRVQPVIAGAKPIPRIAGASTPRTAEPRDTASWIEKRNADLAKKGRR